MSEELPIEAGVIEAAAKAYAETGNPGSRWPDGFKGWARAKNREATEAAIREFCKAMGMKVERTAEWHKNGLTVPFHNDYGSGRLLGDGWEKGDEIARLVSDWHPVEQDRGE